MELNIKQLITENKLIILAAEAENLCIFAAKENYLESVGNYVEKNAISEVINITSQINTKSKTEEPSTGEKLALKAMKPIFRSLLKTGGIAVFVQEDSGGNERFFMCPFKNTIKKFDENVFTNLMEIKEEQFFEHF